MLSISGDSEYSIYVREVALKSALSSVHQNVRVASEGIFVFSLKLFSAFLLSTTMALILLEIIGFGTFSFVFVNITVFLAVFQGMKGWGLVSVLVFDLICVLIALLLRMYILIAPGG